MPPERWVISRVCEEFGCLPSQAIRELERNEDLVFEIIELRAYASTKQACDQADANGVEAKDFPKGPMVDLWGEIEYELLRERNARMNEGVDG